MHDNKATLAALTGAPYIHKKRMRYHNLSVHFTMVSLYATNAYMPQWSRTVIRGGRSWRDFCSEHRTAT